MAWSERQHALLRAMGLRLWSAPVASPVAGEHSPPPGEARVAASPPQPAGPRETAAPPTPSRAVQLPAAPPAASSAPVRVDRPEVAMLDWPALRSAVAGCRACALCDSRTQTVFGVGHPGAHWLVLGEAPGEQEDLSGEPFVGPAGQLLDRMLASLGLTRAAHGDEPPSRRVYIANTLKCRPPRNRTPSADEMAQCEPYLLRQIELLRPRMILAMGRTAVQALLRSDEAIGKLRGRVHRYHGVPLVVTYHPAYLLRNLPDKARAWEDLCLAAGIAEQAA
jgi:uracil-DNA glycosylase family 4